MKHDEMMRGQDFLFTRAPEPLRPVHRRKGRMRRFAKRVGWALLLAFLWLAAAWMTAQ